MTVTVQQHHPRIQINTIANAGEQAKEIVSADGRRILDDAVSIHTHKDIGEVAGTWVIRTVARKDSTGRTWSELISPMDYVEIRVAKDYDDTQGETLVMRGFVDTTTTSVGISSDGTPQVYCEISGRDYGKLLLRALFVTIPGNANGEPITGSQESRFNIPIGVEMGIAIGDTVRPYDYVGQILKAVQGSVDGRDSGIMTIPPGAPKLNLRVDPPLANNYYIYNDGQTPFTGSVWNAIQYYQSPPFFELFITDDVIANESDNAAVSDVGPSEPSENINNSLMHPTLIWRRAPYRDIYNKTAADDASMVFPDAPPINNSSIININLSRSDDQQFSYFLCYPTYGGFTGDSFWVEYAPPVDKGGAAYWDEKLTRRFGLTELEGQLAVTPAGTTKPSAATQTSNDGNTDAMLPLMRKYSKWLYSVYQSNYAQLSGNITIPGDPAYRIGRHVLMSDASITFYIEGIDHDFQIGLNTVSFTTSLTVTRGQYPDGMSPYEVIAGPEPDLGLNSAALNSGTPPPVFGSAPSGSNGNNTPSSTPMNCPGMIAPMHGNPALTQGYGPTSNTAEPIINGVNFHEGLDFAPPSGDCGTDAGAEYAVQDGTVSQYTVNSGPLGPNNPEPGLGNYTIITFADGSTVRYGHQDPNFSVPNGSHVTAGQRIGTMGCGNIGASTGPHLHIAFYDKNGNSTDPSHCFGL